MKHLLSKEFGFAVAAVVLGLIAYNVGNATLNRVKTAKPTPQTEV